MQTASPQVPLPQSSEPASDDIVVTALKDIDDKESLVTQTTLGSAKTGNQVTSRVKFDLARRWAGCAVDAKPGQREWLRKAVDSRTNSTWQAFAMQRLAQINASCAPDPQNALREGTITSPDLSGPYYERGALVIETLKKFVPNLTLTRKDTNDPVVQSRFNRREGNLAKFRLPVDQRYFETAICFVRMQPELAVKLAMTDKPLDTVRRLEAAIVNRGKICVGNARRVYFDGTQFRFYIADAVYRWAVAARGTDTLIASN